MLNMRGKGFPLRPHTRKGNNEQRLTPSEAATFKEAARTERWQGARQQQVLQPAQPAHADNLGTKSPPLIKCEQCGTDDPKAMRDHGYFCWFCRGRAVCHLCGETAEKLFTVSLETCVKCQASTSAARPLGVPDGKENRRDAALVAISKEMAVLPESPIASPPDPFCFDVSVDAARYKGATVKNPRKHGHPTLHAGRQYFEETMYRELVDAGRNVVDVGGTLKRHSIYRRTLHSMQPVLYDYDVQKNTLDSKRVAPGLTFCTHAYVGKPCACLPANPGFMMVDSLYYLTPDDVASMVALGPTIALHHRFEQPFGRYGAEASYGSIGKEIVMTVVDNKNTYRHGNLAWMNRPIGVKDGFLVCDSKKVDDYRWITRFYVVPHEPRSTLPPDEMTIVLDSKSPISSLIEGAPNVARPITFGVWGDFLIGERGMMSAAAYYAVRSYVAGKPRNHAILQVCYNTAKKVHSKLLDFPTSEVDRSITLAAVLGFCANVNFETRVAETKLVDSRWDRDRHANAHNDRTTWYERFFNRFWDVLRTAAGDLAIGVRRLVDQVGLVHAALFLVSAWLLWKWRRKLSLFQTHSESWRQRSRSSWLTCVVSPIVEEVAKRVVPGPRGNLAVSALISAFEVGNVVGRPQEFGARFLSHAALGALPLGVGIAAHAANNVHALRAPSTGLLLASPPLPVLASLIAGYITDRCGFAIPMEHGKLSFPCTTVETPRTLDASIVVGQVDDGKQQVFDHIGLGFSDCIPTVFASNSTNELAAIQTRIYGNPLVPEPNALADFVLYIPVVHKLTTRFPHCPMDSQFGTHESAKSAWNSATRFGAKMAKIHDDAYDNCRVGLLPSHHVRKLFVKKEKKNNVFDVDPTEVDLGDPRHIQSVSQEVHSTLGPFVYAWSKCLADDWSHENWITYAAGKTGVQLYDALPYCPSYFVGDLSRFDRSIHQDVMAAFNGVKQSYCLPTHAKVCLSKQLKTNGFSLKGGHQYRMDGQRKSGDANTSCDNSELNVYMHLWAIQRVLGWTIKECATKLRIMVMGDDIVISGPRDIEGVDFRAQLALLGFSSKPKFVADRREVDFCSKWFWEVGDGGCLAAKPGKMLARVGYSHLPVCPAPLSSIAQGLRVDHACVPFLRGYLNKVASGEAVFMSPGPHDGPDGPTQETYDQLEFLYSLDVTMEEEFNRWLEGWDGTPAMGSHPYSTILFRRDL